MAAVRMEDRCLAVPYEMAHNRDPASDPPSATAAVAAMPAPAVGVRPVPVGRRQPRRRSSSLYARIVALNAAILAAATLALALTPVTVSSPVTASEWIILAVGLIGLVVANAVLLKISFSGLTALVQQMETLDVMRPTERLPEMGGAETRALIAGLNTMLGRLEAERRASMRSTILGQEAERQRIGRELHDEIGQRLTGILLLKRQADRDLVGACRGALRGEAFLYPATLSGVMRRYLDLATRGERPGRGPLTPRESEVVKLIAEGQNSSEIAELLTISPKTVERHRANILDKLGMRDRVEVTRFAIRTGLVEP